MLNDKWGKVTYMYALYVVQFKPYFWVKISILFCILKKILKEMHQNINTGYSY